MKTSLIALVLCAGAAARAQESTPAPLTPSPAKATITIDVDGRKETREIDRDTSTVVSVGKNDEIKVRPEIGKSSHGEQTVWLGVTPDSVPESVRAQLPLDAGNGLLLRSVVPDGPAAKAGLQKNDVLTRLDDQPLTSERQLRETIKAKRDGDVVRLSYLRRGQPATATATLSVHEDAKLIVDDDSQDVDLGEQFSRDVGAVVKGAMKNALTNLEVQSKAIVMDRGGKLVRLLGDDTVDVDTAADAMEKALRRAGVDEKTIADAKRQMVDSLRRNQQSLEKAHEELRKATEDLKRAAAAQARTAGQSDKDQSDQ